MSEGSLWSISEFFEMTEFYQGFLLSVLCSLKSGKTKCIFSVSFILVFALLFILVSVSYFTPAIYGRYGKYGIDSFSCKEYAENSDILKECLDSEECLGNYELKPYIQKYNRIRSITAPNFLPDTADIQASDDLIRVDEVAKVFPSKRYQNEGTEQEALTAVHMALKMKNAQKFDKAQKLFQHAMALHPLHPDILNHYGEFLEEKENDIIKADHLYVRALTVSPEHSRALVNRKRTLPVVDELDERELDRIDRKRIELIELNHNNPSLKRVKKEIYFQHIYHTVAIEGNTMSLAETRMVVETRMSVPGKSVMEHNEILGLESALRYINKTLVNKDMVSVYDILAIHKRVLGHVDPIEAGSFRQNQVFVGEHIPPLASDVAYLMEEFVEWLQSDGMLRLHPVKQAALAHYKLVYIHPFVDGNGRTARLLMNLILMRNGYPPVIIRKQDRSMYYNAIQLANEGDVRPFVRFIAHCTECTLNVYLHAQEYGAKCLMALEQPKKQDYSDIIPL
ncbi:Adenosine monophosphate-protein transferase Fic [Araneus ventricosus]|uniref:Protein adenylyltransferase Fic n=1 Tax=Araneus ventricosus TaxID=182803 RepID=A0A4Y2L3P7_ARAVE|nr:Adenosine monophosphate-protein transferase Fic [Araneus ventricosus]